MRELDVAKRNRILDSTSHIIMTQGMAAVSLSKIAKEAQIASGTLYTYFKDKDDMLKALYLDRKDRVAQAISQLSLTADPAIELDRFMDLVYDYGRERLEDLLLIREFNQAPILRQLNISKAEAYSGYEGLNAFVQNAVAVGAFVALDYQVLMAYAYTPVIEYLVAVQNATLDPATMPFQNIKWLSKRAILKEESK